MNQEKEIQDFINREKELHKAAENGTLEKFLEEASQRARKVYEKEGIEQVYWTVPQRAIVCSNQEFLKDANSRLQWALYNLVTPPIKGNVTAGKLRWRGIKRHAFCVADGVLFSLEITEEGKFVNPIHLGYPARIEGEEDIEFSLPIIAQRDKRINLDFDLETEALYQIHMQLDRAIMFGNGRKYGSYYISGILEQIKG